jgi:hypothetical protein
MELIVREVSDIPDSIHDLYVQGSEDDEEHAKVLGYDSLHDALRASVSGAKLLIGVYYSGLCMALTGVTTRDDDGCAGPLGQVWCHTVESIRNQPHLILPSLKVVMEMIDERLPDYELYSFHRAEHSVCKLAEYAGFKEHPVEHEVNGVKHILAWR